MGVRGWEEEKREMGVRENERKEGEKGGGESLKAEISFFLCSLHQTVAHRVPTEPSA